MVKEDASWPPQVRFVTRESWKARRVLYDFETGLNIIAERSVITVSCANYGFIVCCRLIHTTLIHYSFFVMTSIMTNIAKMRLGCSFVYCVHSCSYVSLLWFCALLKDTKCTSVHPLLCALLLYCRIETFLSTELVSTQAAYKYNNLCMRVTTVS